MIEQKEKMVQKPSGLDNYRSQAQNLLAQQRRQSQLSANASMQKLMKYLPQQQKGQSIGMTETAKIAANNSYMRQLAQTDMDYAEKSMELDNYVRQEQERLDDKEYQRQWNEDEREYQRGRDAVADARYEDERDYQRGRDAKDDERYEDEKEYQRGRDTIADERYEDEREYQRGRDATADERYEDERDYNRQWNEDERDYNRGRDAIADERYEDEKEYQRGRDAKDDERYEDEKEYQRERDAKDDERYEDEKEYQRGQTEEEKTTAKQDKSFTDAKSVIASGTLGTAADVTAYLESIKDSVSPEQYNTLLQLANNSESHLQLSEDEKNSTESKLAQDEVYGEVMTKIESGEFNTTDELQNYLNTPIDTDGDGVADSSFLDQMSPSQRAIVEGKLDYYKNNLEQGEIDLTYEQKQTEQDWASMSVNQAREQFGGAHVGGSDYTVSGIGGNRTSGDKFVIEDGSGNKYQVQLAQPIVESDTYNGGTENQIGMIQHFDRLGVKDGEVFMVLDHVYVKLGSDYYEVKNLTNSHSDDLENFKTALKG